MRKPEVFQTLSGGLLNWNELIFPEIFYLGFFTEELALKSFTPPCSASFFYEGLSYYTPWKNIRKPEIFSCFKGV